MAYIRGANYIWHDDERVHVWAADGLDNWQDSGWIEDVQTPDTARPADGGPSGVAVSQDVADLYVVMRFAELMQQRRVPEIVERAVADCGGNGVWPCESWPRPSSALSITCRATASRSDVRRRCLGGLQMWPQVAIFVRWGSVSDSSKTT